jgi:hypothetical protein
MDKENNKSRQKYVASLNPDSLRRVEAFEQEQTTEPKTFEGVQEAYEEQQASPNPVEGMFTDCPVCANDKVRKEKPVRGGL